MTHDISAGSAVESADLRPADIVISRFHGVRALARLLAKDPSTIHRWRMPAAKGGLDGRVPSQAQVRLLELAKEHGVELTADELISGSGAGK